MLVVVDTGNDACDEVADLVGVCDEFGDRARLCDRAGDLGAFRLEVLLVQLEEEQDVCERHSYIACGLVRNGSYGTVHIRPDGESIGADGLEVGDEEVFDCCPSCSRVGDVGEHEDRGSDDVPSGQKLHEASELEGDVLSVTGLIDGHVYGVAVDLDRIEGDGSGHLDLFVAEVRGVRQVRILDDNCAISVRVNSDG